jgi:PncC family amidohydrolase
VAEDPLAEPAESADLAQPAEPTGPADVGALVELADRLGMRCNALGVRVATVESCTGGLVGHLITEVAGSSAYYLGGFVTYSDDLKREAVGVPHDVLAAHGAVSAQVAMAMATGGRARTGADLAVSVTGIAGPDGGTASKPVGLTYVAVADAVGVAVRRHLWAGDRAENKRSSAAAALELLLERVEATGEEGSPGTSRDESPNTSASPEPA